MASSRVMASSSSANSELTRQSSLYSLKSLGSMNIDDLFRNIDSSEASISRQGSFNIPKSETWREIGCGGIGVGEGEMTLEDFLARAGAVTEEDVKFTSENPREGGGGGGVGRGKKKRELMDYANKAALQRQKRMIKNRESAARSRERKQAYTVELESLVTQLEEENARLRQHQEEQTKKRHKQLLESLIPVTEQRKPVRLLQRSRTVEW